MGGELFYLGVQDAVNNSGEVKVQLGHNLHNMVDVTTVVFVCIGVFSLTLRYTEWFGIENSWLVTFAAGLVQVYALLSFVFCATNAIVAFVVVFATLLTLIVHGYTLRVGSEEAKRPVVFNTIVCTYFLAAEAWQGKDEKCYIFSFVFTALVVVCFVADYFFARQDRTTKCLL